MEARYSDRRPGVPADRCPEDVQDHLGEGVQHGWRLRIARFGLDKAGHGEPGGHTVEVTDRIPDPGDHGERGEPCGVPCLLERHLIGNPPERPGRGAVRVLRPMTRHQNPIADDPDPADRRPGTRWQCRRLGQGQAEQIESIQHSDVAHHLSRTSWPAPLGPSTSGRGRSAETSHYLVIPGLLDAEDLSAAQAALSEKVDMNAAELFQASLISDPLADAPCRTRLARLFDDLEPEQFLAYGRSWRDRIGGYHTLMSNPKILDAVESLIGAEIFGNPVFNVRPKVPRVAAGAVPWHQDSPIGRMRTRIRCCRCGSPSWTRRSRTAACTFCLVPNDIG